MSIILSQTKVEVFFLRIACKMHQAVCSNRFDRNNQCKYLGYFMCLCMSWGVCIHLYSNGLKILCTKPQKYAHINFKIKIMTSEAILKKKTSTTPFH